MKKNIGGQTAIIAVVKRFLSYKDKWFELQENKSRNLGFTNASESKDIPFLVFIPNWTKIQRQVVENFWQKIYK